MKHQQILRRIPAINDTKIQYISAGNTKIYKVTDIDFCNLNIKAIQADLSTVDISENELWDISDFEEFHIRLINKKDEIDIIDMEKWRQEHGL